MLAHASLAVLAVFENHSTSSEIARRCSTTTPPRPRLLHPRLPLRHHHHRPSRAWSRSLACGCCTRTRTRCTSSWCRCWCWCPSCALLCCPTSSVATTHLLPFAHPHDSPPGRCAGRAVRVPFLAPGPPTHRGRDEGSDDQHSQRPLCTARHQPSWLPDTPPALLLSCSAFDAPEATVQDA